MLSLDQADMSWLLATPQYHALAIRSLFDTKNEMIDTSAKSYRPAPDFSNCSFPTLHSKRENIVIKPTLPMPELSEQPRPELVLEARTEAATTPGSDSSPDTVVSPSAFANA